MDARTFPPDTCPLCKQRALSLEEGVLRCTNCQAEAQLDATTRQVRYTLIPKPYAQFEEALKDKWLTRRATFETTELKPLPTVVFFPIIVSLLALCALFGLIGVVLAVRPGMGTTRQIIDEAYAKQNGITQTLTTSLTPTLTPTLEVSLTVTLSGTLEAAATMTPTAASEDSLPPTPPAIAPPPAVPTQPPAPTPSIPTRLPTFTPVASPPVAPPSPTVQLAPTALPTHTPTITPVQNSPVPTPLITRTSTATLTPGQLSAATPTITTTPTPTQKGFTLITGSVAITNVVYAGTANFNNEGDEYIDLFNISPTGTAPASVANYKFRVAGQIYNLTGNLQIAANSGCRIYTNFFPSSDPAPPYNGCGGAHSLSLSTGPTGIWPNVIGTKVELLDSTDQVVATFTY